MAQNDNYTELSVTVECVKHDIVSKNKFWQHDFKQICENCLSIL